MGVAAPVDTHVAAAGLLPVGVAPRQFRSGWVKRASLPGALKDCSLIVPTYARPKEIIPLLAVLGQFRQPPVEIIVVDGSPTADTAHAITTWAKTRPLAFDLLYVKSPRGLTRQRNVGIDASRGDYIFFLDDDCLPQPGYFEEIRDVFRADLAGKIGAVCGAIVNEMGKTPCLRWRLRFALGLAPRGEPGRYYHFGSSVPGDCVPLFHGTRPLDILSGCAMAFRRAVLERERFSEFFDGYSQGEDMEISLRVGRNWQLVRCGNAHAIHHHVPGGRPDALAKGRMEVRNRFFIWKRYSPEARLRDRCRFWLDILFIFTCDLASFVCHPRQRTDLSHACGVAAGALSCLAMPPRYDEPPARRENTFELDAFESHRA